MSDIPEDKDGIDAWLRNLWYEKEKRLENFYKDGAFPEEDLNKPYFPPSSENFKIPIFLIWNIGLILVFYLVVVSQVTRSFLIFANVVLLILSCTGYIEDIDRRLEKTEDSPTNS